MNKKLTCKILMLTGILVMSVASASAQKSDALKPRWLHSVIEPKNSTFVYDVVLSDAKSLKEARDLALSGLLTQAGLEGGQTVQTSVQSSATEQHRFSNNRTDKNAEETITIRTSIEGKPVELKARKLDEYWERNTDGLYHLNTLYQRSVVNVTPQFDNVKLTTQYGVHGLWRSAIVPGWGQLYKGSTVKGGIIMGGTVACIGAIIATDCIRNSYNSKIFKTHDVALRNFYADKRSNFAMGRNISIGALCAIYIYNLVDAVVAPGAKRIVYAGNKDFAYSWSPAVTDDMGIGLSASLTF